MKFFTSPLFIFTFAVGFLVGLFCEQYIPVTLSKERVFYLIVALILIGLGIGAHIGMRRLKKRFGDVPDRGLDILFPMAGSFYLGVITMSFF